MAYWDKLTSRGNVDDRRGNTPRVLGGLGVGGILLVVVFNFLSGGSATDLLSTLGQVSENTPEESVPLNDSYSAFAATVVGSTDDYWTAYFNNKNLQYRAPTLVLFRNATQSNCGGASSLAGPHYCPEDEKIYIDETFFEQLQNQFGAGTADVAQAYVIAHEVGHHVQRLLGTLQQGKSSVSVELQADCFAGLWANSIKDKGVFLPGEIKEALDAASAVGDDNIQRKTGGSVNKETWTHGSSEARVNAFNTGFQSGNLSRCTF